MKFLGIPVDHFVFHQWFCFYSYGDIVVTWKGIKIWFGKRLFILPLYKTQRGGGTAVAQWLRCCATNRKVAGSIPDDVSGFFVDINTSDRTMTLGAD